MADPDSRKGARYGDEAVRAFAARTHAPHDEALTAAYEAHERHDIPPIHVAPEEGKLLGLLLRMIGAKNVVEIGTLAGYSAIWMGRALPEDGRLVSLEKEPHHAEVARANLEAAGLADRVEVRVGDALDELEALEAEGPFCAVFIDADKERYDQYGRWALRNLRSGGLLLGDNAFLFGKLCDEGERAEAMRRFHEEAAAALDTTCIPSPDGLLVGLKR